MCAENWGHIHYARVCAPRKQGTPPTRTFYRPPRLPHLRQHPPCRRQCLPHMTVMNSSPNREQQNAKNAVIFGTREEHKQGGQCEDCADAFSAEEPHLPNGNISGNRVTVPISRNTCGSSPGDIIVPAVKRAQQSHWGTSGNVHAASCT